MLSVKEIGSSRNYILLNFFTILVPIILYPFITKILSPEEFGNFIFIQSIAMFFIAISNFGCLVGFKRNYFECKSKKEKNILLISIQTFIISIFLIILAINYFYENSIFTLLNKLENTKNFWILILIATSLDYISKYYLTFLVNEEKSKLYCLLLLIKNTVYIFLVLLFFFLGYKILSLVYSLLISNLVLFLAIIILQIKSMRFIVSFHVIKKVIFISYPLIFRILFGQLNTKLDKIIITVLAGVANTGIYSIAQSISYFIFQFITSLDKVFITRLNKKLFTGQHNIKNYLTPYLFISGAVTISIILFNDIIYHLLINKKYHGASNIIIILSLYYFFLFFQKITGAQLIFLKKIWLAGNLFFLSVITNFLLNLLLINYIGVIGAALATLFSSIIFMFAQIYFARKFMKLKIYMRDIYLICALVILVSLIQLTININLGEIFNIVVFIVKILIFLVFILLGHLLSMFQIKKFVKNFIKIK
jgi:O-antigen/teichoic acid export membrane protein